MASQPRTPMATGAFVTEARAPTKPIAAARVGSSPIRQPRAKQAVEPTKIVGDISPPLIPQPRVRQVRISFHRKAFMALSPVKAAST